MYSRRIVVINKTGIHARPAADFVREAKKFACSVTIRNTDAGGGPVNAKSLVRILSQGLSKGVTAEIAAEGEGEKEAVDALAALIESGFGESCAE